ncbi:MULTISPECIES: DMT family transporter [unclassified Brevundimonas]|uniref:DMT family transporter n=1 Tax=unclassified Brevundimonas TaxID=2622653 RepID=UPI0025C5D612|nr:MULTISPECIES: EamA family transporter [unclassified Brevundimonas]
MTSNPPSAVSSASTSGLAAYASVAVCAIVWGTTWYAITFQLGAADPAVSVVMRFAIAAVGLAIVARLFKQSLKLNAKQHLAALGQGVFAFSVSYYFVYAAEARVASAVVAIIFAALSFVSLGVFRLLSGQKSSLAAWGGAILGVAGVAVLSWGELANKGLGESAALGIAFSFIAVFASAIGNWFAWRGQQAGSAVLPATSWAMAYGTGILALFALVSGRSWNVDWSTSYVLSLIYLSLIGSVLTFGLYFSLARSRGYALAAYISALTPPIAMLVSVIFEGARFGLLALAGLVLVLAGQVFIARAPKP